MKYLISIFALYLLAAYTTADLPSTGYNIQKQKVQQTLTEISKLTNEYADTLKGTSVAFVSGCSRILQVKKDRFAFGREKNHKCSAAQLKNYNSAVDMAEKGLNEYDVSAVSSSFKAAALSFLSKGETLLRTYEQCDTHSKSISIIACRLKVDTHAEYYLQNALEFKKSSYELVTAEIAASVDCLHGGVNTALKELDSINSKVFKCILSQVGRSTH